MPAQPPADAIRQPPTRLARRTVLGAAAASRRRSRALSRHVGARLGPRRPAQARRPARRR
ncbi:hypothetical protein SALBM135S_03642 [Streptomyces alboniger]